MISDFYSEAIQEINKYAVLQNQTLLRSCAHTRQARAEQGAEPLPCALTSSLRQEAINRLSHQATNRTCLLTTINSKNPSNKTPKSTTAESLPPSQTHPPENLAYPRMACDAPESLATA